MMVEVPVNNHSVTCRRLALLDGNHIFLRTKWLNTSFFVTAMDFPRSWSSLVTTREVEKLASILGMNCNEFFSRARLHLGDCISDSQYSFEALGRRPNVMRLTWTTGTTGDVRFSEEPRVSIYLEEDNNTMDLVPEFLNVLMDTTLVVMDLLARRKIKKSKKVRQLAMRFSLSEKVWKRKLSEQAPTKKGMRGGLDGLVVKSEFPNSTPKVNSSTVSCEPASGLSTPTPQPSLTSLDGRVQQQHELRTPAMENLISPRQVLQSVSSTSKSLNLELYNAERLVSEEETVPYYGHQTSAFCNDRSNGFGSFMGLSHGQQLKSLPSGHQGISESKREQTEADVQRVRALEQRGEAVQVPMAHDHNYILDRVGSSQVQLPMKVDGFDGFDRVPPPKHSPDFTARLYEHGLSSWAQPRSPIQTAPVDIDSMSRPAPTFNDLGGPKNVHSTAAGDKVVLPHDSRKLGMPNSGGIGWINPRKLSIGVESENFELSASKRHCASGLGSRNFELSGSKRCSVSQGREGVIMLSDSEEEDHHNHLEGDPGVLDDEDLLDRRMPRTMEGLPDEPQKIFTRTGRLNDSMSAPWQRNLEVRNMNVPMVKHGRCRSRLESEAPTSLDCRSRPWKRKDRDDAHEDMTDIFEGRRMQSNRFISNESVLTSRGLSSRLSLDAQVFVPAAGAAPCVKAESEYQSNQNAVWQSGDHRYGQRPSTSDDQSREQWKPAYRTADDRSEKLASSFYYENRAQWNTWITEAKTEVTSWEAQTQIENSMTGGSGRAGNQPTENVVSLTSPCESQHFVAPLSLKKLERKLDVVDFPHTDSEHLQSPRETPNLNPLPSEENSYRERRAVLDSGCAENPGRRLTREMSKSKKGGLSSDVLELEKVKAEREFVEIGNNGDSDSAEEHVFEPGSHNGTNGILGAGGGSIADALEIRENEKSACIRTPNRRKLPGRRGRPPSVKLHPSLPKSVSQGANTCIDKTQSDKDRRNTNLQRVSRTSRPVGRPKQSSSQAHLSEDEDEEQQRAVPDSDHYRFDDDRVKEKIKPNEVWALYHGTDTMPRSMIRVKEVRMNGAFWVKGNWLHPHTPSKKIERHKEPLYPRGCGDFEEDKQTSIFTIVNYFSHRMEFTPKFDTVIEVYPRKGEVWALHKKEDVKPGRSKPGRGHEENASFRLVAILTDCERGHQCEILVLRKRTGYRTLWEPGYERGYLPMGSMNRFSHRVPAVKLSQEQYPDLNKTEIWDIDAAAVPECQGRVT